MSNIEIKKHDNCRICGSKDLERWIHLENMPLTDDFRTKDTLQNEFLSDINIFICNSCRASQTLHDISYVDYYKDYIYTSGKSEFANRFMEKLAQVAFNKYNLNENSKVIEIGSGDGTQLSYFKKLGVKVFGFEPSLELCNQSKNIGIPAYNGLFESNSIEKVPYDNLPADIILLTYTFDHMPNPMDFLMQTKKILKKKTGLLIIEIHDLAKTLERKEYCLFEHEHTIYLDLTTLNSVLLRAGFEIISDNLVDEADRRGNSLLVVARPIEEDDLKRKLFTTNNELLKLDKNSYKTAEIDIVKSISKLDEFVESNYLKGNRIAGYGAGGRGVMTLAAMKNFEKFEYLCDINEMFQGKYTAKTHIPIVTPMRLKEDPIDILIVFCYGYISEIREFIDAEIKEDITVVSLLDLL
jgi:SAM-dependent methyltransferase